MYIRRKVFSLLQDETGEERYYSTTNFDLNVVEERNFANKEKEKKGLSTAAKIGIGTAGGIVGAKCVGKVLLKKGGKIAGEAAKKSKEANAKYRESVISFAKPDLKNNYEKGRKASMVGSKLRLEASNLEKEANKYIIPGKILSAPADYITKGVKMAVEKTKNVFSKKK